MQDAQSATRQHLLAKLPGRGRKLVIMRVLWRNAVLVKVLKDASRCTVPDDNALLVTVRIYHGQT